jgi:hypothetical protein
MSPNVGNVDCESPPGVRPHIGEENVAALGQTIDNLSSLVALEVYPHRLLPPVSPLPRRINSIVRMVYPLGDQAPIGIAGHRVFDFDDCGTPVGQNYAGDWDEHVGSHFENTDTTQDL